MKTGASPRLRQSCHSSATIERKRSCRRLAPFVPDGPYRQPTTVDARPLRTVAEAPIKANSTKRPLPLFHARDARPRAAHAPNATIAIPEADPPVPAARLRLPRASQMRAGTLFSRHH